ncbi:MAG: DNA polymerase III subunit delta [Tannerellaceae bacterium]|nr:DNA polymerase III subunit delta [Tannerellaceae bacterium]
MLRMKNWTFEEIMGHVRGGTLAPVYVLMGEEGYFIDRITELILEVAVKEEERDFNRTVLWGGEVTLGDVLNAARRYPLMGDRQVVVVREGQHLKEIEKLTAYVKKPLGSTVLVINYKYKTLDRRRTLAAAVEANGVLFESRKLAEYHLTGFITGLVKGYGLAIEPKGAQMLVDYVGNDLARLEKEVEKLRILLPAGKKTVTAEMVEANVGVSREYNNFELLRAVVARDGLKAQRIARYFGANPKGNPIQGTLPVLFNYFANLVLCHYTADRTERGLMEALGLRQLFQAKDYMTGLHQYTAGQAVRAIEYIRLTDARSKGVGNVSTADEELLKELLYRILH